jgi:hypothetical protein
MGLILAFYFYITLLALRFVFVIFQMFVLYASNIPEACINAH